jgi:hypothetical protein
VLVFKNLSTESVRFEYMSWIVSINTLDSRPNDIWGLTAHAVSWVFHGLGDAKIEALGLELFHLIDVDFDDELDLGHDEDWRVKMK